MEFLDISFHWKLENALSETNNSPFDFDSCENFRKNFHSRERS